MTKSIGQLLSALLIVASAFSNFAFAATPFDSDQEFVSAFNWLKTNGYTSMSTTDAFRPADTLTRQEASRFIAKFGEQVLCRQDVNTNTTFTDSNLFDSTLAPFIEKSAKLGLLKGSNGMFYPLANFTKAQLIAALTRGIKGTLDETTNPWYANYHAFALASGITVETDVTAIDRPITRYEAALMFYRGRNFQVSCTGTNVLPSLTGSTGQTNVTGSLSVVKAADLPDVLYIPGNGSNVRVLKLDLLASQDSTVSSMTFKIEGLVNRTNIKIALTDENGTRLSTDFRTFNSDSESTVGLGNSVSLKANAKKTVYAVIETTNSINERFTISLKSATSVNAGNVSVGGSFPIVSSVVNTTQYASTSITVRGQFPTAQPTNPAANKLYVGETRKQIARFYVEANSQGTNKDIVIKAVTLKSSKNLQGILNNFRVEANGAVVSTATNLNGKLLTFVMADYKIAAGQTRTFYVYADVVGGESSDSFYTMIENSGDVVAFEDQTNAALQIVKQAEFMDSFQIAEGKNFISRVDNINSMNVPTYEQNIRGLVANVNTTSAINVDKVKVYVTNASGATCTSAVDSSGVNANIEKVKLYINDIRIDEDSSVAFDGTKCVYEFSFFGDLKKGANTVEVRFDTQRNATAGAQVKFSIDSASIANPTGNAEYVATSNAVAATDINGAANGGTLIIKNSGLDNIAITNPTSLQKEIVESTNFSAIKFSARANNVRDLKLNAFKLTIASPFAGANSNFITDADLYVDGTRIATESFSNTTTLTFNSLNVTIPKATSKAFEVKVRTYNGNWISATGDVKFVADTFDIQDEKGYTIPNVSSIMVAGNLIDVLGGLNVNGQITNPTSTTIIPATSTASGVKVGTFQMKTDYDTAEVKELAIVNFTGTATTVTCPSAVSCADLNATADGLTVEVSRNGVVLGNAQLLNGVAYITLNSGITINSSSNTNFDVTVKGGNALIDGSNTNMRVRLGVLQPGKILGLSNGASAQTLVTSTTNVVSVTSNYTSSVFNAHYVRATTLTFADQAGPAGTNTLLSIHGQNGVSLFKSSVTADSSKSANLYKISFNHSSNGVVVSNYKLKINNSEIAATDVVCTYAAPKVNCVFAGTYANGYPLSAGQATTVELIGDVTTSTATTDFVTTSLSEGASTDFAKYDAATAAATNATVVWSDNAEPTVTAAMSDWFTDAGIEKLPSNAWTFSRQ